MLRRDFVADCLHSGEHRPLITVIKTAQAWGKPPSFLLGGAGEWSEEDRTLAVAYQIYTEETCPECGQPMMVCRDPKNSGWFETKTATCYAAQAVGQRASEPGFKPSPGEIIYPVLEKAAGSGTSYGAPPEGWES